MQKRQPPRGGSQNNANTAPLYAAVVIKLDIPSMIACFNILQLGMSFIRKHPRFPLNGGSRAGDPGAPVASRAVRNLEMVKR